MFGALAYLAFSLPRSPCFPRLLRCHSLARMSSCQLTWIRSIFTLGCCCCRYRFLTTLVSSHPTLHRRPSALRKHHHSCLCHCSWSRRFEWCMHATILCMPSTPYIYTVQLSGNAAKIPQDAQLDAKAQFRAPPEPNSLIFTFHTAAGGKL